MGLYDHHRNDFAAFTGNLPSVTEAALDSAKEAVMLCITMIGVMSFWVGLMKIAERAGLIEGASKKLEPLLTFLFPSIPKDHKAREYISTNMIANFFGLGLGGNTCRDQGDGGA